MKDQLESYKHKDKRKNIPTRELRGFVEDEEKHPKVMLYPRDPSLDPQLVWKGKDRQDQEDLAVPTVPIYIQEKILPQAIIDSILAERRKEAEPQLDMFSDFNGIEFQQLIEFYQHEQNWSNRMILGDSLLVMNSLAEKEGLRGKVQMIYIDPPYGIKFGSNWQISTRKATVHDTTTDASRDPEVIKAFRDTWELGIHSYLSYLRDRFISARDLLSTSGSIFIQIGDENLHLVRCVMDEIFGSENFVSMIIFRKKTMPLGAKYLEIMDDYILWYTKKRENLRFNQLYKEQLVEGDFHWSWYELPNGERHKMTSEQINVHSLLPSNARIYRFVSMWPPTFNESSVFNVKFKGKQWLPPVNQCYPTNPEGMKRIVLADRLEIEGRYLRYILYFNDYNLKKITANWQDTIGARNKIYVVQTTEEVVKRCILTTTNPGDLVLDPTCGSGTTAYVAEQWGRRWITVDTSRVALALARTRLMAGRYPYYILTDSHEGIKKEAEITGHRPPDYKTEHDIRKGFVYERVPHIRLKDIANNAEIDEIDAKWQGELEPIRSKLNSVLDESWEEWEVPREQEKSWPEEARDLLENWWELRRARQKEIDASIARNAEQELLYDKPYEDPKRIRVAGPFTVESLSPHRVLPGDDSSFVDSARDEGGLINILIEYLKKAGVQNRIKNERLKFDRLDTYAGRFIQAEGEFTDAEGNMKRVAVCFGPEHGTVGTELVKEAAKEAVQGIGFDILLVCGFAFDPHCNEESLRYPRPVVLITKMNPDLAMGDELLKKTGAGNLFMVFGEPDIEIKRLDDGKITIEVKGVDVYDPTTGQIRSDSTDDIACWFIDSNYNGESFFVRHAYFTGAEEPYKRLKTALKAEVDEEAWSSIYSTVSRPFDPPKDGKIAIKVINHYGDEVLKVYNIEQQS